MKRDTRTLYLLVIILILIIVFILIFTIPKNYVIISISTHKPCSELSTGLELRLSPIMPASYLYFRKYFVRVSTMQVFSRYFLSAYGYYVRCFKVYIIIIYSIVHYMFSYPTVRLLGRFLHLSGLTRLSHNTDFERRPNIPRLEPQCKL